MAEDKTTVELSKAEGLVLFEMLARFSDEQKLEIADEAEEKVLWSIHSSLESVLPEPFAPNYKELLQQARKKVRDES